MRDNLDHRFNMQQRFVFEQTSNEWQKSQPSSHLIAENFALCSNGRNAEVALRYMLAGERRVWTDSDEKIRVFNISLIC